MVDAVLEKQLHRLVTLFLEENAHINLSALRTEEKCWIGNVLDSLPLLELPDIVNNASTLIDIGTGGGFPLLPLAIAAPQLQCTGLDSIGKKMKAIERIAHAAEINNVRFVTGRAEQVAQERTHRAQYDIVTARAVSSIATLLDYCSGFAKPNGHIVLWKSMHCEEELRESAEAQRRTRWHFARSHVYTLPGDFGQRQLLIFSFVASTRTPPRLPRP